MSLFLNQSFISHSGINLPFKIECDDLTPEDLKTLAEIVSHKFKFKQAIGIPRGGNRFAHALNNFAHSQNSLTLIVDDVYTTGKSMNEMAKNYENSWHIGIVIFARNLTPNWIYPIFSLNSEFN